MTIVKIIWPKKFIEIVVFNVVVTVQHFVCGWDYPMELGQYLKRYNPIYKYN